MKNSQTKLPAARKYFPMLLSFLIILGIGAFVQTAQGQIPYKIAEGSKITVSGTSNLHDWTMLANNFTCEAIFKMKSGQVQDLNSLNFILPVTNLKSKETLMDTRAYKALKADKFNQITFKLTDAMVVQKTIKATGNLTIAGITQQITIQGAYSLNNEGTITLTGNEPVKMSDYGMKAPSFMLGALRTGNEVTIDILLKLKASNLVTQAISTK